VGTFVIVPGAQGSLDAVRPPKSRDEALGDTWRIGRIVATSNGSTVELPLGHKVQKDAVRVIVAPR
jgi:hypothetical protein